MENFNLGEKSFTLDNIKEIKRLFSNPLECLPYISGVLDLKEYSTKARHAFIVDYFHGISQFSTEICLGLEQSLTLLNFGKDLFCMMLGGKSFQETEEFFKKSILSLNTKGHDDATCSTFSPIDIRKIIDFFLFTFFQHYALYAHCFSVEAYTESRTEVVLVETALTIPLSEASSKEELEAKELADREAFEAEEKARKEEIARVEAEKVAEAEALKMEEEKKKPQSLDAAIDFLVREKLDAFKQSFFEECASEQKRIMEKLAQLDAHVVMTPSGGKSRKSQ
ncbi:hypothetical protein KP509_27G057400 [Ceratopteris richardii]|uniref:Uncharacterized protein n=1 Tax=Ceratopteris richardii TaxID=49495 RepID=A0A8T2RJ63_CERRI|nr:hypothetical protein KP509_27G057400 [Ceratopteris richardii]